MLDKTVQGSTANLQEITWSRSDGTPQVLTGYTLTGKLYSIERRTSKNITGTLTVTNEALGIFTWSRSSGDVSDIGMYEVQFIATGGSQAAISYSVLWQVEIAR